MLTKTEKKIILIFVVIALYRKLYNHAGKCEGESVVRQRKGERIMTYEEIVGYVKKKAAKADAKAAGQVAVQIDITGEGEGAFYVAAVDGKFDVQPYEYYDYNAKVVADGNDFVAFLDGKKGAEVLSVEGYAA